MTKRFKFLRTGCKSNSGNRPKWVLNKWYKHEGNLELCNSGFHCSKGIYQAFSFVQGEILAQVEVKGKHIVEDNKEVWEQMRVIKTWKWQKKDSVLFACYAARLVLKNYEDVYPNDKRVREAIESAERYAKSPTKKNRLAAESACAESAARSAWFAADSAAESAARSAWFAADSAAESARSAAESAWSAWSAARSAAWSAWSATRSVAWSAGSAAYKKLDIWMLAYLKNLKKTK